MTLSRARISELRELARLEGQLQALEQDIRHARAIEKVAARGRLDLAPGGAQADSPGDGERIRLTDGAEILVRPIEREDAERVRRGFDRVGALSRYRAFLEPIDRLTAEQLRGLTQVDHRTHEELIAIDATGQAVALAGYAEKRGDPTEATLTMVVADAWQRRGVATALVDRIAARARSAGVQRLQLRTIVGDRDARRVLAHVGATATATCEDGISRLTVAL